MIVPPLLVNDVPINCINHAAITYHIPAKIIIAILTVEHGKNGEVNHNKNGTDDYGPMQVNSIFLPTLAQHGITPADIQNNPCINVAVGTWVLSGKILASKHPDDLWQSITGYHSWNQTFNQQYQASLKANYQLITKLLK